MWNSSSRAFVLAAGSRPIVETAAWSESDDGRSLHSQTYASPQGLLRGVTQRLRLRATSGVLLAAALVAAICVVHYARLGTPGHSSLKQPTAALITVDEEKEPGQGGIMLPGQEPGQRGIVLPSLRKQGNFQTKKHDGQDSTEVREMLTLDAVVDVPSCFVKNRAYTPLDSLDFFGSIPQQTSDASECQSQCASTKDCASFSFDYITMLCHLQDAKAVLLDLPEAFTSGPRSCPAGSEATTAATIAATTNPETTAVEQTSASATETAPKTSTAATTITKTTTSTAAPTTTEPPAPLKRYPAQPPAIATLMPSLFCFLVLMPSGYEPDLVRAQVTKKAGVFACNAYAALSVAEIDLGNGIVSTAFTGQQSNKGTWGSWLNTENFLRAWDVIIADGGYRGFDWIVKVDPDCVFFPNRLRTHLAAKVPGHPQKPMYIKNCPKDIGMLGSIEIFSHQALDIYSQRKQECYDKLHPNDSGEDGFIKACMDLINAEGIEEFSLLVDGYCAKGTCRHNLDNVAFHPFKNVTKWFHCWGQATWAEENKALRKTWARKHN